MTKPLRQHGAARQLGAINEILKSQPHSKRPSKPRLQQAQDLRDRAQVGGQARRQSQESKSSKLQNRATNDEQSLQSQQLTRSVQRTFHQRQRRSCSPQKRPQQCSDGPHQRVKGPQNELRNPQLPQQERRGELDRTKVIESKSVGENQGPRTASRPTTQDANTDLPCSGKRKRLVTDDGYDVGHVLASKKLQIARLDTQVPAQPLPLTPASRESNITETTTATTTPSTKSHGPLELKATIQLPSPPFSNVSSECESLCNKSNGDAQEDIASPTLTENTREKKSLSRSTSNLPKRYNKRQRDDTEDAGDAPKRPRQVKAVGLNRLQRPPSVEHPQGQKVRPESSFAPGTLEREPEPVKATDVQRTCPVQHQVVRPESSFAPVTANPGCNVKLLDYLDDSVPVLYSTKINHANNTELLNCPSDRLIWDALDAIETGFKPQWKYGWPAAIRPLGHTPGNNNVTKVLSDVDLYLHETEKKLHVATDRGLVLITDYLRLIGVPETQPVRFDGRIPPWAKAVQRAREHRRVVQVWGKDTKIAKGTPLKSHQVALSLETHVEVRSERAKEATATAQDVKMGTAKDKRRTAEVTEAESEEEEILEVRKGNLPLPLGSTVVVYKVDQHDMWAYGRLSGTDKTGYFPFSHTCPADWSLENSADWGARYFKDPLPESTDLKEKDWNGLAHWIRREGCSEGPTWKETCAATAAQAKTAKDQRIAARNPKTGVQTALSSNTDDKDPRETIASVATEMPAKQTKTAIEVTTSTCATIAPVAENAMEGAASEAPVLQISKDAVETKSPEAHAKMCKDSIQPANDDHSVREGASDLLEAKQVPLSGTDVVPSTVSDGNAQHAVDLTAAPKSEMTKSQVEEGVVDTENMAAHEPRNPFTVPRYDPFARNDDIEYDWGDSDEEL